MTDSKEFCFLDNLFRVEWKRRKKGETIQFWIEAPDWIDCLFKNSEIKKRIGAGNLKERNGNTCLFVFIRKMRRGRNKITDRHLRFRKEKRRVQKRGEMYCLSLICSNRWVCRQRKRKIEGQTRGT